MAFLTVLLAVSAHSAPAAATLDQLRSQPDSYRGRMVRVTGQLDECWNMGCGLCPIEATPRDPQRERCLAISFDRLRGGQRNYGFDADGAFRYADVVVTARFDPACLQGICTDRASVLLDAQVEEVTRRRRSSEGLIPRPDPLIPAPEGAARSVAELLRPRGATDDRNRSVRVFGTESDPSLRRSAVVCRGGRVGPDIFEWPTSYEGALSSRSTEDRYRCWSAWRDQKGWVLVPN